MTAAFSFTDLQDISYNDLVILTINFTVEERILFQENKLKSKTLHESSGNINSRYLQTDNQLPNQQACLQLHFVKMSLLKDGRFQNVPWAEALLIPSSYCPINFIVQGCQN